MSNTVGLTIVLFQFQPIRDCFNIINNNLLTTVVPKLGVSALQRGRKIKLRASEVINRIEKQKKHVSAKNNCLLLVNYCMMPVFR